MPVYVYECGKCLFTVDKLTPMSDEIPEINCPICKIPMRRKPTFPAMVKIKGMGGYPSRRAMINKGTAPYSKG